MTKDYLRGQGFVKEPKIENELGVGKDSHASWCKDIF